MRKHNSSFPFRLCRNTPRASKCYGVPRAHRARAEAPQVFGRKRRSPTERRICIRRRKETALENEYNLLEGNRRFSTLIYIKLRRYKKEIRGVTPYLLFLFGYAEIHRARANVMACRARCARAEGEGILSRICRSRPEGVQGYVERKRTPKEKEI